MKRDKVKHIVTLVMGWIFLILGILGLFLPILQGILFILIGLYFLSKESRLARRLFMKLKQRYPSVYNIFKEIRVKYYKSHKTKAN